MLPVVIVSVIIILIQLWNRRAKQPKIAPKVIFPLHKVAGVALLAVFFAHGLPWLFMLMVGLGPWPNVATGCLLAAALLAAVVFGVLASLAKGPRRRALANAHRASAIAAAVLLAAHLALAFALKAGLLIQVL